MKKSLLILILSLAAPLTAYPADLWKEGEGFIFDNYDNPNASYSFRYFKNGSNYDVTFSLEAKCSQKGKDYYRIGNFEGKGKVSNNQMVVATQDGSKFTFSIRSEYNKNAGEDDFIIKMLPEISDNQKVNWQTKAYERDGLYYNDVSKCGNEVEHVNKNLKNIIKSTELIGWVGD